MSVENNSQRSIDGLNTLFCDTINVVESIEIDGDNGNNNQLLSSNGTKTLWSDLTDLLNNLTVSAPLSFVSGTFYDGSVARAIQIADDAIANAKLANSTISGKELGTNLDNLTISAPLALSSGTTYNGAAAKTLSLSTADLTINAPLTLNSGTTYNGITAKTLDISNIANSDLSNSTISGISLGGSLATLNFDAPLSNFDYNGGTARTITIADDAIGNVKLDNSTISGKELGTNLADLELYYGLEFLSGATYNGGTARTINTKFKSGGGITANADGLHLVENSISGVELGDDLEELTVSTGLELNIGSTYYGADAKTISLSLPYQTISDRVSYEGGKWLYTITATEWRPNDDSTFYNVHIEDDSSSTFGRAKIGNATLEVVSLIHIPFGWSPAKIFIDCRNNTGANQTRTYYLYKIRNWGGTGQTYLGTYYTNSETTLAYGATTYGEGESGYSLMIKMMLTSTLDHLGGGYITLTPP